MTDSPKIKSKLLFLLNKMLEYIEDIEDFSLKIIEYEFYSNIGRIPRLLLNNLENVSILIKRLTKYNPTFRKRIVKKRKNTLNKSTWNVIENISRVKSVIFQEFDLS